MMVTTTTTAPTTMATTTMATTTTSTTTCIVTIPTTIDLVGSEARVVVKNEVAVAARAGVVRAEAVKGSVAETIATEALFPAGLHPEIEGGCFRANLSTSALTL